MSAGKICPDFTARMVGSHDLLDLNVKEEKQQRKAY